jgi:hypothetical protein
MLVDIFSLFLYVMDLFHYKAYGLVFRSEFEVDGLTVADNAVTADVEIKQAKLDVSSYPVIKGFLVREMTEDGFLYSIRDYATFLISNGNTILVEPLTDEKEKWQMYLLGSVMGALLQQRGFLTLHGSAVLINEKAHLILGPSGMGKSSIAMALQQKGHLFLTDDICAIKNDAVGIAHLYPGSRHTKLWKDAIDRLQVGQDNMANVRNGLPKFRLTLEDSCAEEAYPIARIFLLGIQKTNTAPIELNPLNPMGAMQALNQNVYRKYFAEQFGLEKRIFTLLGQLANQIPSTAVNRRQAKMDVKAVAKRIEEFIEL